MLKSGLPIDRLHLSPLEDCRLNILKKLQSVYKMFINKNKK
jgi:hypothetical protein